VGEWLDTWLAAKRWTGNSLMRDAGVDQELRMREVGTSVLTSGRSSEVTVFRKQDRRERARMGRNGTSVLTMFSPEG
jgi:hypothetical protein